MCCARSSAARLPTAGCWAGQAISSTRWYSPLSDLMQDAYPELNESADRVRNVLAEETRFATRWTWTIAEQSCEIIDSPLRTSVGGGKIRKGDELRES